MEENQRVPTALPLHGHRKLTGAGGMLLAGEVAGQEALRYFWDSVVLIVNRGMDIPLDPMPEKVAADIFALLAILAFYQTEEK